MGALVTWRSHFKTCTHTKHFLQNKNNNAIMLRASAFNIGL
jgi:hypothetical protein